MDDRSSNSLLMEGSSSGECDQGSRATASDRYLAIHADAPYHLSMVGFFDLLTEVRHMIYQYCYGSRELVLQYKLRTGESQYDGANLRTKKVLSGLPSALIHQVSRHFAHDLGSIWHSVRSTLAIDNEACSETCLSSFASTDKYIDLRSRLHTLNYISDDFFEFEGISWVKVLMGCPSLTVVNVTLRTSRSIYVLHGDMYEFGRHRAKKAICETMNQGVEEIKDLDKLELDGLAWILENIGRTGWSVTGSFHKSGIVHYNKLTHPTTYADRKIFEQKWKFKFTPKKREILSRVCETEYGIRSKWLQGVTAPVAADVDSEEWQIMKMSTEDPPGWCFPRVV